MTLRLIFAAAVAGFLLSGAGPAAAEEFNARPPEVRIEQTDELGPILADSRGRSLYTWVGDRKAGESLCTSQRYTHANGKGSMSYELPEAHLRPTCVEVWPPFLASADAKPVGAWTIITRDDGTKQWAVGGKPLYTFVQDTQPGEVNGMSSGGGRLNSGRYAAWAPLDAPRGIMATNSKAGRVLMTEGGKTLYVSKGGFMKASVNSLWKPLSAPALTTETAPKGWSVVSQPDGARQWAYQGKAIYTYTGDAQFGDQNGTEEPGWSPVTLQKPLAPPSELSIQMTSEGPVFADANGKTLYVFGCADEAPDKLLCDLPGMSQTWRIAICGKPETCAKTWRPVVASPGAKPVGRTWSIVMVDPTARNEFAAPDQKDAIRVWAYRGKPVYTFVHDEEPGDFNGDVIGNLGAGGGFNMLRVVADGRRLF